MNIEKAKQYLIINKDVINMAGVAKIIGMHKSNLHRTLYEDGNITKERLKALEQVIKSLNINAKR